MKLVNRKYPTKTSNQIDIFFSQQFLYRMEKLKIFVTLVSILHLAQAAVGRLNVKDN
jgi:hypothetical protein